MAPAVVPKTPTLSPCSPPRKKAKFSLRLKGKKTKDEQEDEVKHSKVHRIFSSPSQETDENYNGNNMDQEPEIPSLPHTGLLNQGNTCYANAVLQVLRCCPGFEQLVGYLASKEKVMDDGQSSGNEKGDETEEVVTQLEELLCQMCTFEEDFSQDKENCIHLSEKGNNLVLAAETSKFMEAFRELYPAFECNLQHDAQEFLCSLIMALQESATSKTKKSTNYVKCNQALCQRNVKNNKAINSKCNILAVTDNGAIPCCMEHMFQGKLVHQTKCLNCEESKLRYEDFQDVSVPVVEDQPYLDARKKLMLSPTPKKNKESVHTLQWAIGQFASSECLQGDNKYFCENCSTYCEAEIRTCFDQLPGVLTIHLKRFTSSVGLSSKITSNLQTPFVLSVQEWCSKKCQMDSNVYELFGIVIHSGMTSGSGHYETYVRIIKDQNRNYEQNSTANSNSNGEMQNWKETKHMANGFEENIYQESSKNHVSSNGVDDAPKMDINGNSIFDESGDKLQLNGKSKRKRSRKSENENMKMENGTDVALKSPESTKEAKRKKVGENSAVEEEEAPLERQGQGQTSCMSVITRYFQRSRKISSSNRSVKSPKNRSNSGNNENSSNSGNIIDEVSLKFEFEFEVEGSTDKLQETASNEKPKGVRSIENYFKKTSCKSHGKNLPKSPAIRKLRFQGNSEDELVCNGNSDSHKESQNSSSDEEYQRIGALGAYDESLKNGWVHFDDCTVTSLSEQDIISILSSTDSSFTSPYLLFYRKVESNQ